MSQTLNSPAGKLYIVCDDGGPQCVENGVFELQRQTMKKLCASMILDWPGAIESGKRLASNGEITLGAHLALPISRTSDAANLIRSLFHSKRGSSLAAQKWVQREAEVHFPRQLEKFSQNFGELPPEIGVHQDVNVVQDANGVMRFMPWYLKIIEKFYGNSVPALQYARRDIRSTRLMKILKSFLSGSPSKSAEEFEEELKAAQGADVELIMHPAVVTPRENTWMVYNQRWREKYDLDPAVSAINSGAVENAGYRVVSVRDLPAIDIHSLPVA